LLIKRAIVIFHSHLLDLWKSIVTLTF